MAEPDWQQLSSEIFQEDLREEIAIATVTVDVRSEERPGPAAKLLLDPLPQLVANFDVVEDDWTVSFERVNADIAIPFPPRGPRKLVGIWVALIERKHVHGIFYRAPRKPRAAST